MTWKIAHPWWDSNPRSRSLDYIPSSIDSRHVSGHQSYASQIYSYISGSPKPRNFMWKWQKYELQMSDDSHFEFNDLWENGAIYSFAYGRSGFSTKKSYRNNKWSTFPKNAYRSLSRAIFQFFVLTMMSVRKISIIRSVVIRKLCGS